nr:MAG TPA: RNA polymerase Rpb2-like protein [Caudoviricetes sp.]
MFSPYTPFLYIFILIHIHIQWGYICPLEGA